MEIDLSPAAVERLVQEKKHLVEREAGRLWRRFFVETGVVSYEDVLQEAYKALIITLQYFNRSKSPIEALDPYLVLGIQGELKNWVARTSRQFNYTFDTPEMIENIPETVQDLMPKLEDLEILMPLSKEAMEFLSCLFTPPKPLKAKIRTKVTSGKPYSKSILPVILEWLEITYDQFNRIREELRSKCRYSPLLSTS